MTWRPALWWRRVMWRHASENDGRAARAAEASAQAQLRHARSQASRVTRVERAARSLANQVDAFAHDIEAALRNPGDRS
jgi:hypothetical protein